MAYSDAFGVEYSDDSTILRKAPTSLEGKYYVTNGTTNIAIDAFKGCELLNSIYLPSSIKKVYGLNDCKQLTEVHFGGTLEQWLNIEWLSLFSCGYDLYINEVLVSEVVIPLSITEIKPRAFYYCKSIKSLVLHDGVKSIGESAFNKSGICGPLNLNNGLESIAEYSFFNTLITSASIPSSLHLIGKASFACCYSLKSFIVSAENSKYKAEDNLLYNVDGKLCAYGGGLRFQKLTLPNYINSFQDSVFHHDSFPQHGLYMPSNFEGKLSSLCTSCKKMKIFVPQGTATLYRAKGLPEKQIEEYFEPSSAFINGVNCIKAIAENPFRVLGVYSNASQKEIVANSRKIKQFTKVGKSISFPLDLDGILPPVIRTEETVDNAIASLTNEQDKFIHSLFWFVKHDTIDEIALNHFLAGNVEKADEIFMKTYTWSSWLNQAIMRFVEKDFSSALTNINGFIDEDGIDGLAKSNCSEGFTLESDIIHILTDELLKSITLASCRCLVKELQDSGSGDFSEMQDYINTKITEKYSLIINEAIAIAKSVDASEPKDSYEAAIKLINDTKDPLAEYEELVGKTDPNYIRISDRLANQILQCGINFYNNSDDDDKLEDAMEIQKKALDIALGKMAKDRCQQNYDILLKHQKELPPKEVRSDCKVIFNELEKYNRLPDKISFAITLLNNTKATIEVIKSKLGATNEFYLKISTLVVSNAIHNVIEEVNESQKNEVIEFQGIKIPITPENMTHEQKLRKLNLIKSTLREAWKATILMDGFDLETKFKNERYAPNREALKNLCQQMGVSTYVPTPRNTTSKVTTSSSTSTSRSTSQNKSANSSKPSESIVAWIICIIIVEVIWGLIFVDSEGFWSGVLYSLMGWFILPINYGVTWLMLWIADKINE